jgi:hypothetical protein
MLPHFSIGANAVVALAVVVAVVVVVSSYTLNLWLELALQAKQFICIEKIRCKRTHSKLE